MNGDLDNNAAEYVLGTLDEGERVDFERRLAAEPEVRQAVARWGERLALFADALEPVMPPAHLWGKIEARIDVPATDNRVSLDAKVKRLRRNVVFWRGVTAGALALATALALFVIDRALLTPAHQGKSYVAVVNRGGDAPALIVRVDTAARTVYVRPVSAEAPPGRSLELWYINAGQAPKSLGLVQNAPAHLALPENPETNQVTIAVTSEPEGGSPTGGPTGPIVYSGAMFEE